jgi:uncharacterized protein YbcC (UPF0753/DUF2309 family)
MKSHNLESTIQKIASLLPNQGPIKDFIHQNILLAYLELPFEEALIKASAQYKARAYMDMAYYRQNYAQGAITLSMLNEALDYYLPTAISAEREFVYHALFAYKHINNIQTLNYITNNNNNISLLNLIHAHEREPGVKTASCADLIINQVGINFDHEIHQLLFRLLGSYVDQGVSLWPHLDQWPSLSRSCAEFFAARALCQ